VNQHKATVRVVVELNPAMATLLRVMAEHLHKSESETVADALRLLFVKLPRPGDGATVAND
jgi:hypothetical protein